MLAALIGAIIVLVRIYQLSCPRCGKQFMSPKKTNPATGERISSHRSLRLWEPAILYATSVDWFEPCALPSPPKSASICVSVTSTSRGRTPSEGPTIPSFSMRSIILAERL